MSSPEEGGKCRVSKRGCGVVYKLADGGLLHQRDETPEDKLDNEILQKVILPHIRGYARIEGSNFDAKDFIITTRGEGDQKVNNNREKLRRALDVPHREVRPLADLERANLLLQPERPVDNGMRIG